MLYNRYELSGLEGADLCLLTTVLRMTWGQRKTTMKNLRVAFFCFSLVFAISNSASPAEVENVVRHYVQTRDGGWTLSRTLTDFDTGENTSTRTFPNPQTAESAFAWHVLNTEDTGRPYKKYRETYSDGVVTAEFFESAAAIVPYNTVRYTVDSAAGPDAHGWRSLILTGRMKTEDSETIEVRRKIHWTNDVMLSEFERRPEGSRGPYRTWIRNTIIRTR